MLKKFIAFSGGIESSAMCVLYGGDAQPIFTDTGWEHKLMLARIDMFEAALKVIHGPASHVIRIRAKNVEQTGANTLPEYIRARRFAPSPQARFCTRLFKIKPMDDFLSSQGECEVMIGLNADEADDREVNYGECSNVTYRYPLIDAGMSRADCGRILAEMGLLPDFPPYMNRGGCVGCFYKSKKEHEAMALFAPDESYTNAELEEAIQDKRGRYYHIHPEIPNMREFIEQVRHGQLFSKEEMYQGKQPEGRGCGAFCHR